MSKPTAVHTLTLQELSDTLQGLTLLAKSRGLDPTQLSVYIFQSDGDLLEITHAGLEADELTEPCMGVAIETINCEELDAHQIVAINDPQTDMTDLRKRFTDEEWRRMCAIWSEAGLRTQ